MRLFPTIAVVSLLVLAATSFPLLVFAANPIPKLSGPVNDFANVMTPPYEKRLASLANELLSKTGAALMLVTLQDLGGADPNDYANRLYNLWATGKTWEDRGVLILVSVREQKMRIRTGTGLKALLSPRQLAEIQDRFMAPLLKRNNYDDGLLNGVVAIAKIIGKDAGVTITGDSKPKPDQRSGAWFPLGVVLLVLGAGILAFAVVNRLGRRKPKLGPVKSGE